MKSKKQTKKKQTPKQRIRAEERRLRGLEYFQKNKQLFDKERQMRLLRDTRMEAQQIDDYLRSLNPAYRQAAEPYGTKVAKMRKMFEQANPFRGRMKFDEFSRFYPGSYDALRSVAN